MAVDSTTRRVVYAGNGKTTAFPFVFKVFDETDIAVSVGASGATATALAYATDFTVALNGDQETNPGGTVTVKNAPAKGANLAIISAIPFDQPMKLTPYDGFNPETLNDNSDRQCIQIQQLAEQADRAITVEPTDARTPAQLLDDIFDTEKAGQASAAAAARSAAESKQSAETSKQYSDAVTAFKDQIVTTANNINAVKTNAENIGDIQTVADNITAVKTNANAIAEIKTNAANIGAIKAVYAERENIQATVANLPQIHAIGEEARQSQESAKVSAATATAAEANTLAYKTEAVSARNQAEQIAAGISALDGSGVAGALIDLRTLLGASAVETDEYLRAVVDAEGRLLFWIDHDGNIGWSKGIPEPIQKVLTALQEQDKVHTAAIADTDDRLSTAIEADSPEWLKVWQDSDGKVLGGIRTDGSFEFFKGIPQPVAEALAEAKADREAIKAAATASTEELQAQITSNDEDITALQAKDEDIDDRLATSVVDAGDWLQVVTDKDGKVLYGVKGDGSFENGKGVPTPTAEAIAAVDEKAETNKAAIADTDDRLATEVETDNTEWLKVWKDEDGKVLGGIRTDGTFEFFKGTPAPIANALATLAKAFTTDTLTTKSLTAETINWSDNNMSDLETLLLQRGFKTPAPIDWSDASSIQIPEPRCAVVNIISKYSDLPYSKTANRKDWLEFWDMQGNYFKKRIILNNQGDSSSGMAKHNFAMDICNDEWEGDDTFSVRIGDWVPQDSFHCKAYYTDYFRGIGVVCYKLMDEVLRTRGIDKDRVWKKALKASEGWSELPATFVNGGDNSLNLDTGARCFPDGFPVIVHYNGEFYGIYSWQLKKHRDNMHMDKKTAEHIQLDGKIGTGTILNYTGDSEFKIDWTAFEVRNPKSLYCMDGTEYKGDTNQKELIDETSENYDASNKNHVRTKQVKEYIKKFSLAMYEINQARANNYSGQHSAEGAAIVRETFEKYFDPENWIDYICFSDVVCNRDGFWKNWQWTTYDGQHWYVNLYDTNISFGETADSSSITPPYTYHLGNYTYYPVKFITEFYSTHGDYGTGELEARYAELRKCGLFNVDHIIDLLQDWVARIGVDNYDKEYKKWTESPCHGDPIINTAYWELVRNEDGTPTTAESSTYSSTTTYAVGDTCSYGINKNMGWFTFKAVAETTGNAPITKFKHYDSIYRVKAWLTKNLSNMDTLYNYSEE